MKCKICQSPGSRIIREKLRHGIERKVFYCAKCDYAFLDPQKKVESKFYTQQDYRKAYGPSINKASNNQEIFDMYFPFQKDIINEIKPVLKRSMSALDIGCSAGHFLQALKPHVGKRVGMELQKDAADFVQKKFRVNVYQEPIEAAHITEGPFDLITALQVVEHVEDLGPFLEGIARNLKPGGYFYIEVPNINDILLSGYHNAAFADFYFREPHVSYFSIKSLKKVLEKAGFKGTFKTVQRYNIINHLHWQLTNSPQGNFALGNSDPQLVTHPQAPAKAKKALNTFFRSVNDEYKKILIKHSIGENVTFLGKKYAKNK